MKGSPHLAALIGEWLRQEYDVTKIVSCEGLIEIFVGESVLRIGAYVYPWEFTIAGKSEGFVGGLAKERFSLTSDGAYIYGKFFPAGDPGFFPKLQSILAAAGIKPHKQGTVKPPCQIVKV